MNKTYHASDIEQRWSSVWEKEGYFKPSFKGTAYSMVIPPPNVTGSLHMGHGFQQTLMDALVRYHRMDQHNTLWVVGTDHAGIATQMVVERKLQAQGIQRQDLGREDFLKQVWEWKKSTDHIITSQIRRLGASVDWSRECFTMDKALSASVLDVFIKLYEEGLIYRGQRLVNWDPKFRTAISDLEVISEEEAGSLWHIRYFCEDSKNHIIVATTRPETMFGDVAVAVHPEDERYRSLIGQKVLIPIVERSIPVIADEAVDPTFGTGCLKITPAHDFNDYEIGKRHNLPLLNIFTQDAHLNDQVPVDYQNLERFTAREKIIAELTAQNKIEKIESHLLRIPRGDRSGVIIEPYLTDQWFVRMQPLAEPALQAVQKGTIRFVPENWTKTYIQWLENIQDWCISRQLWWGHRIPAWYDSQGNIFVGENESEVRKKYQLSEDKVLEQDADVLDTWFSSSLWPFSTLGWPQPTEDFKTFFPTQTLVTGFDIIFFWVARMVMMSLKFTNQVPFKEVYITGLIRDHDGQKMSKTKGNVLDPIDLIDGIRLEDLLKKRIHESMDVKQAQKITQNTQKQFPKGISAFGTDALRFTFCALATQGRDIRFDMGRIEGYRNFCNKLWNASRYVLMNCEGKNIALDLNSQNLTIADHWILSRLEKTIQASREYFKLYRFDLLAQTLYEFLWNDYCDWYLEFTKPILQSEDHEKQKSMTRLCLLTVLEKTLRLLHPIIPFITEEIWQTVAPCLSLKTFPSLMLAPYPTAEPAQCDEIALFEIEWIKTIITQLRTTRSAMNISPKAFIEVCLRKGELSDRERFLTHASLLYTLVKIKSVRWLKEEELPPICATAIVNTLELFIPLVGLLDTQQEISRLEKNISKLNKEKENLQARISNPGIPISILEKTQQRLDDITNHLNKLNTQILRMQELSKASPL